MTNHSTFQNFAERNGSTVSHAAVGLWRVFPPIILVFGTFGNVVSVVIFTKLRAKRAITLAASTFFGTLAIADLGQLYTGLLPEWLLFAYDVDLIAHGASLCNTQAFMACTFGTASSYLLTLVTLHRAACVLYPARVHTIFSRTSCYIMVAMVFLFPGILHGVFPFVYNLRMMDDLYATCRSVLGQTFQHLKKLYQYLSTLFLVLPVCIIVPANAVLIRNLKRSNPRRGSSSSDGDTRRTRKSATLTITLIALSALFVLSTAAINLATLFPDLDDGFVGGTVANLLWYANAAVNFYLYCLGGSKVNEEFRSLFLRGNKPGPSMATPTSRFRSSFEIE